jgi:hypothetical protein
LKLTKDKLVTHAVRGHKKLTWQEIQNEYGNPPIFEALMWPETNHLINRDDDAYWTLMSQYEAALTPLICHVVSMIDRGEMKGKTVQEFAYDLYEVSHRELCKGDEFQHTPVKDLPGNFYPALVAEPEKYIQRSEKLVHTL